MESNHWRNAVIKISDVFNIEDDRPWRRVIAALGDGIIQKEGVSSLAHEFKTLSEFSILIGQEPLNRGILKGFSINDWDDAVSEFGLMVGQDSFCFLGPMRAMEKEAVSIGFIAAKRKNLIDSTVLAVQANLELLGELLFGLPMSFHGRKVEFYDAGFFEGAIKNSNGKYFALFTPFYFTGWHDVERQKRSKRTIMFHNLLKKRFQTLTLPLVKDCLNFNEKNSALLSASEDELDQAIALWITLHELLHGNGPIPLFGGIVDKIDFGLNYAAIEELRVEMSSWVLLTMAKDVFCNIGCLAQELIIAERILRSARGQFLKNRLSGGILKSSDAENGAFWFSCLEKSGALELDLDSNKVNIDKNKVWATLNSVLGEIYDMENSVVLAGGRANIMEDFCTFFRSKYFIKVGNNFELPESLRKFNILNEDRPTMVFFKSIF